MRELNIILCKETNNAGLPWGVLIHTHSIRMKPSVCCLNFCDSRAWRLEIAGSRPSADNGTRDGGPRSLCAHPLFYASHTVYVGMALEQVLVAIKDKRFTEKTQSAGSTI